MSDSKRSQLPGPPRERRRIRDELPVGQQNSGSVFCLSVVRDCRRHRRRTGRQRFRARKALPAEHKRARPRFLCGLSPPAAAALARRPGHSEMGPDGGDSLGRRQIQLPRATGVERHLGKASERPMKGSGRSRKGSGRPIKVDLKHRRPWHRLHPCLPPSTQAMSARCRLKGGSRPMKGGGRSRKGGDRPRRGGGMSRKGSGRPRRGSEKTKRFTKGSGRSMKGGGRSRKGQGKVARHKGRQREGSEQTVEGREKAVEGQGNAAKRPPHAEGRQRSRNRSGPRPARPGWSGQSCWHRVVGSRTAERQR